MAFTHTVSSPPLGDGSWWWTTVSTPSCTPTTPSEPWGGRIFFQLLNLMLIWRWQCFCRVKVPTGFAMMITSLQLLQMVVGCAINLMAFNYKSRGEHVCLFVCLLFVCIFQILLIFLFFLFYIRCGMWCDPDQHNMEPPYVLQLLPPLCKVIF